jgi:capsular polysaccharide biosynthesis protein
MELSDYLRILRQRGWIILLLGVLTAGAAYVYSNSRPPVYKASVRVLVNANRPDFGQTQAARALLRDYAVWLNSSYRAGAVIDQLQLDMTPGQLMGDATIAASDSTNEIQIDIENSEQQVAGDISRVWAEQLIQWRDQENTGLRSEDRINAELLDDPGVGPVSGPDSRQPVINGLAGGVFGAMIGVVVVFLLEWIQSGVLRRAADVERYLEIPVVGSIPKGD